MMRKTIKRPDGTEEVVEGTPEEIAEYERRLREEQSQQKKRGILKDEVDHHRDQAGRLPPLEPPPYAPPFWPGIYGKPIWIVSCSVCGRANCNGFHGDWFRVTHTLNASNTTPYGDHVVLRDPTADRT